MKSGENKVVPGSRFSLLLSLLIWFGFNACSVAHALQVAVAPIEQITVGDSTSPLNGPRKFNIGDSPVDPASRAPLWADPGFDDSKWETVNLTPPDGSLDPVYGVSGIVPGWTARGYAGHWGYGWYRLRVQVTAPAGAKLAIEGPPGVDDGYQVFQNGILLGSFGRFSSSRPVVYNTQPMMFSLPQLGNASSATRVLAFRVWMEASTPANYPDVGGLRSAPVLGKAGAVAANDQLRWLDAFRAVADGSMLIVAGDVVGKGLQAGMLVALLVGAIRTSAHFDPDPLAVLKVLNQRLCGRSHAAATCLALGIAEDGGATLANAGHLPPYLNGQPLEIEGALPLGMIEDAEFSVLQFRFTQGDHLLLMSDGIAEATDLNGNLFGFERVLDLLRNSPSAAAIATAAQSFG